MIYLKNMWSGVAADAPVERVREVMARIAGEPIRTAADASFRLGVVISRLEGEEDGMLPEELSALLMLRSVQLFLDTLEQSNGHG